MDWKAWDGSGCLWTEIRHFGMNWGLKT